MEIQSILPILEANFEIAIFRAIDS